MSETEIFELKRGIGMVIRDVSSSAIATRRAKRESILPKSSRNRGINKREATASSYYPEEWPEEFICHGAGVTNGLLMRWGQVCPLSGQIGD